MKIIKDTREIKGYDFSFYNIEVIRKKLECGDYKLADNNRCVIERKANTGEVYLNLCNKKEKERFYRECELLIKYENPILLCEFPEDDFFCFPENSNIPRNRWSRLRIQGWLLKKFFDQLSNDFPKIQKVFAQNKYEAEKYVVTLLESYENGRKTKFNF